MARAKGVSIVWERGPVNGTVQVHGAGSAELSVANGEGRVDGPEFSITSPRSCRLLVVCAEAATGPGACATRITIAAGQGPFTFFLRDVHAECPLLVPEYGVAVTSARDEAGYEDIAARVRGKKPVSQLDAIERSPEETYEEACRVNRAQHCPTWLGLGRDMRLFRVGHHPNHGYWGYVQPRYHSMDPADADPSRPHTIAFAIGRGAACRVGISRRLEEGVLPILTSSQRDGDVCYRVTAFATLEKQPLSAGAVRGTAWRAAYAYTGGNRYTEDEGRELSDLFAAETVNREEEVVCCLRVTTSNSGSVPRYAWFKALHGQWKKTPESSRYAGETGASEAGGRAFGVTLMDGRPMPQEEMAVLLQPGRSVTVDMLIPHRPLPAERASALAGMDVGLHLDACREFWRAKLRSAARIRVPELAVDERIRAGLLHCDLVALGREPDGNVLATVGWYAPIGSESAPIMQFFDAAGWHNLAERAIQFFLDRQREDGCMQNFGDYQLETGGVLWTMGEHFRMARDAKWVERVRPNILKACDYLLAWRNRNKQEELRGRGYGLQDGRVADPEDFFRSFMLNALSYLGIQRSAEMLAEVDPPSAERLAGEARAYREDIRAAFREATAQSPLIPTGDGTWVPAAPPWADHPGALALYAEGGTWFTHAAFGARDSLIGPLYLAIGECIEPHEQETAFLLRAHQELFTVCNAGLSQPYYCRHDFLHLKRGEVKAFLKTYYNQLSSLQDRETYTFWEHYYGASQHKTHEEGWFLMQTRWMLWLEEGRQLKLLSAIPRRWLADGQRIELERVATYFGPLDLEVRSHLSEGHIEARISCREERRPETVQLRLPHPEEKKAAAVEGGEYDPATETVRIESFSGEASVRLRF